MGIGHFYKLPNGTNRRQPWRNAQLLLQEENQNAVIADIG